VKGRTGTGLGGRVTTSARKRKAQQRARAREEQRWADLSGPVVSYVDESVRRSPQSEGESAAQLLDDIAPGHSPRPPG
jgi:hypothetical protein